MNNMVQDGEDTGRRTADRKTRDFTKHLSTVSASEVRQKVAILQDLVDVDSRETKVF
jgi:hypothetical protein